MKNIECIDCTDTERLPFVFVSPQANVSFVPDTTVVVAYVPNVEQRDEAPNVFCTIHSPSRTPFVPPPTAVVVNNSPKERRVLRRKLSYSEYDLEYIPLD